MARKHAGVVGITTAPRSRAQDIAHRQHRYLLSMAIRTACFVGAVFVGSGWLRWVLVAGALVLPYVAVVMANVGDPGEPGSPEEVGPDPSRKALGPAPDGPAYHRDRTGD